MKERLLAGLALSLLAALVGGCPVFTEPPMANRAPVTKLVWPQLWPVDEPASLDASGSFDFDGDIDEISLVFGDGTFEQARREGTFEHVYAGPGTFEVRASAYDDDGARSELLGEIVLVEDIDEPACSCALPCFSPGACVDGRCFLRAMSSNAPDDEAPPAWPGEVLVCDGP